MFLVDLFHTVLTEPILNAVVFLYTIVGDFGIAIILLTAVIRLALSPLSRTATANQKKIMEIQPQVKELRKKYKDDMQKQGEEMQKLYKQHGISNPMAGCLPMLLQFPILIALYRVFWKGLTEERLANLYPFVPQPDQLDASFLGLINLNEASIVVAVVAGVVQFFQFRLTMSGNSGQNTEEGEKNKKGNKEDEKPDFQQVFQKQMQYIFPVFAVLILTSLPSAIGLYWITTSAFSIGEYYTIQHGEGTGEDGGEDAGEGSNKEG